MGNRYRIVRDSYAGYEVQVRRWWWPFWTQAGYTNTHATIERAEQYAVGQAGEVVKELGSLT